MVLNLVYDLLEYPVHMSTLVGVSVIVTHVYISYFVLFVSFLDLGKLDY